MTTRNPRDQKQLEQATSRSLPPGAPLDDETAALRDGWLSLGTAVDRANAGFCEEELLSELLTAPEGAPPGRTAPSPSPLMNPRPVEAWRMWPALLASALALTMLLAASLALWRAYREPIAANVPVPPKSALAGGAGAVVEQGAWSDSLDEELADAADHVRSLVAQATRVDASISVLAEQLDLMSSDMTNDSL